MQDGVPGKLDGGLEHRLGLVNRALLVLAVGFAALVLTWIGYVVLVAAIVLWG